MPRQRVAPPRIFPAATRAPKPPIAAPEADAHRQTGFVVGADVELVLAGLELEGASAQASAGAKFRKQPTAAALGLWSRAWLSRLAALHAIEWGNYTAAIPLIRAAADYQACEILLLETGAAEWEQWLENDGIALDSPAHATSFQLHQFRAAEVLAAHAILGPIYREASALALPHFGATLLLAGSDSTPDRILMTFGDRDFHVGLAELVLGWLLRLGIAQCEAVRDHPESLATADADAVGRWVESANTAVTRADRCCISPYQDDDGGRLLVSNWRRLPRDARKKVVL